MPCAGTALYKRDDRAKQARALPPRTRESVELLGREPEELETLQAAAELAMLRKSHRQSHRPSPGNAKTSNDDWARRRQQCRGGTLKLTPTHSHSYIHP
jgi:hypothetical protein